MMTNTQDKRLKGLTLIFKVSHSVQEMIQYIQNKHTI